MSILRLRRCCVILNRIDESDNPYYLDYVRRTSIETEKCEPHQKQIKILIQKNENGSYVSSEISSPISLSSALSTEGNDSDESKQNQGIFSLTDALNGEYDEENNLINQSGLQKDPILTSGKDKELNTVKAKGDQEKRHEKREHQKNEKDVEIKKHRKKEKHRHKDERDKKRREEKTHHKSEKNYDKTRKDESERHHKKEKKKHRDKEHHRERHDKGEKHRTKDNKHESSKHSSSSKSLLNGNSYSLESALERSKIEKKHSSSREGQTLTKSHQKKEEKPKQPKSSFLFSQDLFSCRDDKVTITKISKPKEVKKEIKVIRPKKSYDEEKLKRLCRSRMCKVKLRRLTKADLELAIPKKKRKLEEPPKIKSHKSSHSHTSCSSNSKLKQHSSKKPFKNNDAFKSKGHSSRDGSSTSKSTYNLPGLFKKPEVKSTYQIPKRPSSPVKLKALMSSNFSVPSLDDNLFKKPALPVKPTGSLPSKADRKLPSKISFKDALKVKSETSKPKTQKPTGVTEFIIKPILNGALKEVYKQTTDEEDENSNLWPAWLCPICGRFDTDEGSDDFSEVKRHIIHRHAEHILDVDIRGSKTRKGFKCKDCELCFDDPQQLVRHLAYDHGLLGRKIEEFGLNPKDFEPLLYSRKKCAKRLKWRCLRCPRASFVKKPYLMFHLAHSHFYEYLILFEQKSKEIKKFGHYFCSEVGCEATFKNSSCLLAHEQRWHQAMEGFIGVIIGENDLYEEIIY